MKKVAVCHPTPECASFAVNLVKSLGAEGAVEGEFAFQAPTPEFPYYRWEFSISDLLPSSVCDYNGFKSRVRSTRDAAGRKVKIADEAQFSWADSDIRMHYCYHFAIQPYNLLVEVEGVLSYEDIQCQLRAPLWGYVSFLPNERSLKRRFDDCNEGVMKFILDACTNRIDSALKQVVPKTRQRAIRRLSKHVAKISIPS